MASPVVIVHGGSGEISDENRAQLMRKGTQNAARAGYILLKKKGTALDAVQAAVCVLEDDPSFNAGTGSTVTSTGDIEMDAVIMDGKTLNTGAIANVHNIKNPILLARKVMEETEHCMLVGPGANLFAEEVGFKTVPKESLLTERAQRALERKRREEQQGDTELDTVGAVAVDCLGNIAFATSTGGTLFKKPGRVGDSPIVGAGGYALNGVGGVSCTGEGEAILKVVLAHQIITLMKQGISAQEASDKALADMAERVGGSGGVIVLSKDSEPVISFTTERMAWAWAKNDCIHFGIDHGEDQTTQITFDNK